jgi:hypothetical protein
VTPLFPPDKVAPSARHTHSLQEPTKQIPPVPSFTYERVHLPWVTLLSTLSHTHPQPTPFACPQHTRPSPRSDLHLYVHAMPGMRAGDVLGHEFMGVVEEVRGLGGSWGEGCSLAWWEVAWVECLAGRMEGTWRRCKAHQVNLGRSTVQAAISPRSPGAGLARRPHALHGERAAVWAAGFEGVAGHAPARDRPVLDQVLSGDRRGAR